MATTRTLTDPGLSDLVRELHPVRSRDLDIAGIAENSTTQVWWRCERGPDHEWRAKVRDRAVRGTGCPFCAGKRVSLTNSLAQPHLAHLAAELHPTLNGSTHAADVVAGGDKYYWWRCPAGPDHVWRARISHRVHRRSGCPFCAGRRPSVTNSLAQPHLTALAAELDPHLNDGLRPADIVATTERRLWWRCPAGPDHVWRTTAAHRVRGGTTCPACLGQQVSVTNSLARPEHADVAAELDPALNGGITPAQVVAGSERRLWWRCTRNPQHTWRAVVSSRTRHGSGCPKCHRRRSLPELQLAAELSGYFPGLDPFDDRIEVASFDTGAARCDIVLRAPRIVVEYDGGYWHARPAAVIRDRRKTQALQDEGWQVIRVREHPLTGLGEGCGHAVTVPVGDAAAATREVLAILEQLSAVPAGSAQAYAQLPRLRRADLAQHWYQPTADDPTAG